MSLIGEQCVWLPAIPNALLIFIFTTIVLPAGYFYARHCGVYSIDEDRHNKKSIIYTKIWMIFSQYVIQYTLVISWSYYSFSKDVNYLSHNHPWLFIYCLIYVLYSITTTVTFALYCHPSKQLYSTWLFVSLVLLLFPSIAILSALFLCEEEHHVAQFDAGLSQPNIKFCLWIDVGTLIISIFIAICLCHHIYVLLQALFAPYICQKEYLQYEPYYYSRIDSMADHQNHCDTFDYDNDGGRVQDRMNARDVDTESESEIDYNYREKICDDGDVVVHKHNYNRIQNENKKKRNIDSRIMCSDQIEME